MSYKISTIAEIINATILQSSNDSVIENLLTDSRKLLFASSSLFFALPGTGRNGNDFIEGLYKKGVRSFVVDSKGSKKGYANFIDVNILQVNDVSLPCSSFVCIIGINLIILLLV